MASIQVTDLRQLSPSERQMLQSRLYHAKREVTGEITRVQAVLRESEQRLNDLTQRLSDIEISRRHLAA